MSTLRYIAYGSNLLPARLAARIPIAAVHGAVRLPGYALDFSKRGGDGSGKCNLAPRPGAEAWGVVYEIAAVDRPVLDRIEGLGRGYAEARVELEGHGTCFFYTANADWVDPALTPFDWYKAFVVAGARTHGLPNDYLARLAAVVAARDPDEGRRAENLRVLLAGGGSEADGA